MQTAILNARKGTVEIYEIPSDKDTARRADDYVQLELMDGDCQYIIAEKVGLYDFRNKSTASEKALLISSYSTRILELIDEKEDMTTSDLQGAVDAIVMDIIRECSK